MASLQVQSLRFLTVGLVSNAVLYLFYVVLTWIGLSPFLAVGIVFVFGVMQTFVFNRRWTFSQQHSGSMQLPRYLIVYIIAFLVNILCIYIFVNLMAYPHQWVQAVAIPVLGVFLFIGQRYWVFGPRGLNKDPKIK